MTENRRRKRDKKSVKKMNGSGTTQVGVYDKDYSMGALRLALESNDKVSLDFKLNRRGNERILAIILRLDEYAETFSEGRATGIAVIANSTNEFRKKVRKIPKHQGIVLVTSRFDTVEWGDPREFIDLVFRRVGVKAVIFDLERATGHGPMLCREFNVPHIYPTLIARKIINDGDEVYVNGCRQRVEIYKKIFP